MPSAAKARNHAALVAHDRSLWWNADYVELLGRRLRLDRVDNALDVGSGHGLWGRTLLPVLGPGATIAGLDLDHDNVAAAVRAASRSGLSERLRYLQGAVERLPFGDASFDLVTCQTLLIHVADVDAALCEMLRVLAPGGTILLAEPSNRISQLVLDSVSDGDPIESVLSRIRFYLQCERGKAALGEGSLSIGDLLPGLLARAGAREVQTFLNDKALALVPPYATPEQQTLLAVIEGERGRTDLLYSAWSREATRRRFLAGGGRPGDFDAEWDARMDEKARVEQAVDAGTYAHGGGRLIYVVSGTKAPAG